MKFTQRFTSTFTGYEFFLADHVVKGKKILPGVAYLEMAYAAVKQIAVKEEAQIGIRLKNIVWIRPLIVGEQPLQVHLGLYPENNREFVYQVYSGSEEADSESILHSQGNAVLSLIEEAPTLNLIDLQTRCNQTTLSSSQCYELFQSMGIQYGLSYQGIEKVYVGESQVLAKLSLPSCISDTQNQFILHPSLLDAAFQATVGLIVESDVLPFSGIQHNKPVLPFALEELEIFSQCRSNMWALIRYSEGGSIGDKVQKLDIDLCDDKGIVCVQMRGFTSRMFEEAGDPSGSPVNDVMVLEPCWKEQAVNKKELSYDYSQHIVMVCETYDSFRGEITEKLQEGRCICFKSEQGSIDKRFQEYTVQAFEEIQKINQSKCKGPVCIQIVTSNQGKHHLISGLSGLLKTAQLENTKIIGQLIEVDPEETSAEIIEKLIENKCRPMDTHIRYLNGQRWVKEWGEMEISQKDESFSWKDHGVYVITGGTGGLGLIFAKEIVQQAKDVTLILTGRSSLNKDKQAKLKELEFRGARIDYRKVDVVKKEAVDGLIKSIKRDYGSINGIIHSAGVIKDSYILQKNIEELQDVLEPKVSGLVNLDEASKDLQLDFFVLFSSISGSLGNLGQADYSTANAFMDAYAKYRNTLVAAKKRQGQTLSFNWPLWKEGGMQVNKETERMMMQSMGMVPMSTQNGIKSFYQGLDFGKSQIMVVEGNLARISENLFTSKASLLKPKEEAVEFPVTEIDTDSLLEKVQVILVRKVSELLKVKVEDVDVDVELNDYGFDSVTLTELSNLLNKEYHLELTPTLFFEYSTIYEFSVYLIKEYDSIFASRFLAQKRVQTQLPVIKESVQEKEPNKIQSSRVARSVVSSVPAIPETADTTEETIAIVGMSGKFPMASNLDEFWGNISEGKDCIREIPKERWDWEKYYGDPTKEANKTNIKWGGFIDGVGEFDPTFFRISPREAELMDPQQRLLMTYVWKAIEDAGYSAQSLSGTNTAIFVATTNSGYSELLSQANVEIEGYSSTGIVPSVGPNRMSYFLNIHGPSEPVETACSSSLVAIHRAMNAIKNGDCDTAIVGGVNTILSPEGHISFNKAGMLSEDGRCKTFSDKANGYVRGEGVGMLFLKKLKDAEKAGDHIYGVIRGTSENHGGRANSLTAPNPKAQAELLIKAYTKAGVDPKTITYIETHGTGTELGDPIEINGLKTAFKDLYQAEGLPPVAANPHCGLGSIKTNIGHLEVAAGIAGV
ncbi:polyketide synthase, partial [Bacillus wiedmannii]